MNANDRAITGLVMLAHALVHTYEMTIPLFVVAWLTEFQTIPLGVTEIDVTTATVGVIVTVSYGLFGVGALPGGILVDRFGSRRLIAGCLFGMGIAYLLLGIAPNMVVVAVALVVWGVAASVYHPAGLSLVSRGVTERGTGLAYHGAAGNVGIGFGPLVAALLLVVVEWRTAAVILAVPALLATLYAFRAEFDETAAVTDRPTATDGTVTPDETAPDGGTTTDGIESLSEFLRRSKTLFTGAFPLVFLVVVCSGLYYRGTLTFLPELLRGLPGFEPIALSTLLPDSMSGVASDGRTISPQDYFYAGLLIFGVAGQYAGGKLSEWIPVSYGITAVFAALAALAVAFVPVTELGLVPLLVFGAVLGVVLFVPQPMYQAAVAERTPADTRGLSYGYTYLGVFGVGALGGGIAGWILAARTVGALFLTLAAVASVAAVVGLILARR